MLGSEEVGDRDLDEEGMMVDKAASVRGKSTINWNYPLPKATELVAVQCPCVALYCRYQKDHENMQTCCSLSPSLSCPYSFARASNCNSEIM